MGAAQPIQPTLTMSHEELEERVVKSHEAPHDLLLAPFLKDDYSMEALHRAIASGDLVVNYRSNPNATPFLNILAFGAHERRMTLLLREGANPNEVDSFGVTATMAAIYGHNFMQTKQRGRRMAASKSRPHQHYQRVLLSLISAKADLNRQNIGGSSPLALAARYGMGDVVRVLVRCGANISSFSESANDEMLRHVRRGLSESTVSQSLLCKVLAPKLGSRRLAVLIHEYATPLPYWDVPHDQCFCARCIKDPATPGAVVASFNGLSAKFGYAGDDSPLVVVRNASGTPGSHFDADDIDELCTRLRREIISLKVSLTRHPFCLVICGGGASNHTQKERLTQFVFEELHATAFYLTSPFAMPLYASGRTTGVVVTVDSHINIAIIYEGYQLPTEFVPLEVPYVRGSLSAQDAARVHSLYKDVAIQVAHAIKSFETPASLWKDIIVIDEQDFLTTVNEAGERVVRGCFLRHLKESHSEWLGLPSLDELKVKVGSLHATWVGASILSSLSTSCGIWISSREYSECGAGIVHRKCF